MLESERTLQYVLAGLFDTPKPSSATSVKDIESFGIAQKGDQAQERRYLVGPAGRDVKVREVPQRRGGVKYAIDQMQNPDTIVLSPGGRLGDIAIISGQVSTAAEDANAIDLFRAFEHEIKHRFSKVKSYYVGPEAKALLNAGVRLPANVRSPEEYDLKP